MSKPVNKHPYRLGNEHGEIRFGHLIKKEKYGVLIRTGDDKAHYIDLKSTGDVKQGIKNSTNCFSPGSFTIKCGEDIEGTEGANPRAFSVNAKHGDVKISAPLGNITLEARNITLKATGVDGKNGVVKINGNEKVIIKSPDIEINSSVSTKIFSEGQIDLIGKGIMNCYGGLIDFADGATKLLGSKSGTKKGAKDGTLTSLNEDRWRSIEDSAEALANELKKSGLPGKLKDLANSDEIADLTGQMSSAAAKLEGQLSLFEKDAKLMSNKLDSFFKEN